MAKMPVRKAMTDDEVLAEMRKDNPLNRARVVLTGAMGRLEQLQSQRGISPVDVRRIEFETVRRIALELGVKL